MKCIVLFFGNLLGGSQFLQSSSMLISVNKLDLVGEEKYNAHNVMFRFLLIDENLLKTQIMNRYILSG